MLQGVYDRVTIWQGSTHSRGSKEKSVQEISPGLSPKMTQKQ